MTPRWDRNLGTRGLGEEQLLERRPCRLCDGLWDARAAASLGWRFVGVGEGERAERLRAEGAVAVVSGYEGEGFLELVRRIDEHPP